MKIQQFLSIELGRVYWNKQRENEVQQWGQKILLSSSSAAANYPAEEDQNSPLCLPSTVSAAVAAANEDWCNWLERQKREEV